MHLQKPRQIAATVLRRSEKSDDFVEDILAKELKSANLKAEDRGLVQELTYGVIRWQAALDWLIKQKTQGRTQKPTLRAILRMGLYQIFWLSRVPDHAAVHESVELAKHLGCSAQAGFINAVLRSFLRDKAETQRALAELGTSDPALAASHPQWLHDRWVMKWGGDAARESMNWNNTPPQVYARANTLRVPVVKLLERWRQEEGVEYDFFTRDWTGENIVFLLTSHPPIETLGSFRKGWFYVQDPSTLLAVRSLNARPGERALDCCAAPGGKATFLAQVMENTGVIVAQDIDPVRLKRVEENRARLGAACVQPELLRSGSVAENHELFDRVLVDVPCSNTGVIRRRVQLRWRLTPREITRLGIQQTKLLSSAADRVQRGGTLVYSTCSLEVEENQQVVGQFLAQTKDFHLESERELVPFRDGVDGAYVARMVRTR